MKIKLKLKRKNNNHCEGIYSIDFYAYKSKISHWNPMLKVIFAFITLVFCIIADNFYVSLIIALSMGFITVGIGKIEFGQYLYLLKIPIAFIVLSSIAIAVNISTKPLEQYNFNLYFFYLNTSNENIIKTVKIIMKAFGAISSMYMMTLSTSASEIISVLRKIHIPKIIIELMNMIYRFIFILLDVQCKMKNSAQSRLGYVDFKTSCYCFASTSKNLLIVSLKKANAYYDAMESRCYDGEMNFLEENKEIKRIQILASILYILILTIVHFITR